MSPTLVSDWPMSELKHKRFSLQFVSAPGQPTNLHRLQLHNWSIFYFFFFLAIVESDRGFLSPVPNGELALRGRSGGRWVGELCIFSPSLSGVHPSSPLTATTPSGLLTSSACHCQWCRWNHCSVWKGSGRNLVAGKSKIVSGDKKKLLGVVIFSLKGRCPYPSFNFCSKVFKEGQKRDEMNKIC